MEGVTSRLYSDELLDHFFFRHVSENNVLRVGWQNTESVRNPIRLFFLLLHDSFLKFFPGLSVCEFLMLGHFSDKSVARNNVALDYLTQIIKRFIADQQFTTNSCARCLFCFNNVDVDKMLTPELPSQGDARLASGRRPKQEISSISFM
jgi:hypothetical protein